MKAFASSPLAVQIELSVFEQPVGDSPHFIRVAPQEGNSEPLKTETRTGPLTEDRRSQDCEIEYQLPTVIREESLRTTYELLV